MKRYTIDSLIHVLLTVSVMALIGSNIYLYSQVKETSGLSTEKGVAVTSAVCDDDCQEEVAEKLSKRQAELAPEPVKTAVPTIVTTTAKTSKQTSYVSLGTTFTTTSTTWTDVPGSEVYIDLVNDYSQGATASWEASLSVAHDNGTVYARLFDATNGIAVDGSELSLANKDEVTLVSSGNLPFWAGRNLYKVQIKSLNSFEVKYTGGRIKIVH